MEGEHMKKSKVRYIVQVKDKCPTLGEWTDEVEFENIENANKWKTDYKKIYKRDNLLSRIIERIETETVISKK